MHTSKTLNRTQGWTFALLFFVLIAFTCCNPEKPVKSPEDTAAAVIALERQALGHWSDGDPVNYFANFAADASYIDDIGAHSRIDSITEIRTYAASLAGLIPPHGYEMVDPRVQVYGEVAILSFFYHGSTPQEGPATPWKATSVYRLKDGRWQVVHAHWSLLKAQE